MIVEPAVEEVIKVGAGRIVDRPDDLAQIKLTLVLGAVLKHGNIIARMVRDNDQKGMQVSDDFRQQGVNQNAGYSRGAKWSKEQWDQYKAETCIGDDAFNPKCSSCFVSIPARELFTLSVPSRKACNTSCPGRVQL